MKLFYCHVDIGNFGDDMNAWFWDEVFPTHRDILPDYTMFGIGSILWKQNIEAFERIMVMGSGTGVNLLPKDLPDYLEYSWVRGPMTAREMGLDSNMFITDPAALVSRLPSFDRTGIESTGENLFIPHVSTDTLPINWASVSERSGLTYLSPRGESKSVISRIAASDLVVTESLHGAILADAFRIPWIPVAISPRFSEFKWQDWAASLEMEIEVREMLASLKSMYASASKFRSLLPLGKPKKTFRDDPNTTVRAAELGEPTISRQMTLSDADKGKIRGIARTLSPVVEGLIVRELKQRTKGAVHLSSQSVLESRLDQMQERIQKLSQ